MAAAAVCAARAVGYRNAGTIEFLLEGRGEDARFYFLEMNTRLQVEHPVTEAVTGVDLVRAQLRVASGDPLPWRTGELRQCGHAIECRIYAEDPANDFVPQAGRLLRYREPGGPGVRVDSGVVEGSNVTIHYDPMLAKLVVSAESRGAAIDRMRAALRGFAVLGVRTNISFLSRLVGHPLFASGDVDTGFVERELEGLIAPHPAAAIRVAMAAAAVLDSNGSTGAADTLRPPIDDPWGSLGAWGRSA
jgi:acetyl/propionyl-CoA carboxylase alpha subunit